MLLVDKNPEGMRPESIPRCDWVGSDPLYRSYHDREWGVPVHDDRLLFEFLILEGAQAGLSWITILKKRDAYRAAFAGFDPEAVAGFDGANVAELLKPSPIYACTSSTSTEPPACTIKTHKTS